MVGTKNKLNGTQRYQLQSAIARDKEITNESTAKELADKYTKELGFLVTHFNVLAAAKIVGAEVKKSTDSTFASINKIETVVRKLCELQNVDYDKLSE